MVASWVNARCYPFALSLHVLGSALFSEPGRLLLALQGFAAEIVVGVLGNVKCFYCPHRRETINAFLPPTPSPSSLQKAFKLLRC